MRDKKGRFKKGYRANIETEFKPGQEPYNKGIKRGSISPETEFKPGQKPKSFKGFGIPRVINRLNRRNEIYATIDEQKTGCSRGKTYRKSKVTTFARYLWEKVYGEIPKGYVVFNNGSPEKIDIHNLELITRKELLARNLRKGKEC